MHNNLNKNNRIFVNRIAKGRSVKDRFITMFSGRKKHEAMKEFEEQILAHMNALYNFGYRLSGNAEEASDLVQEACLRAFRFYHQYEKGTNFKAWIFTILRNTFINQYRKEAKEPPKIDYDEIEGFVSVPQANRVEEEVFGESVQTALNRLPEELRTTIVLFYVEDLKYREIAKVMKCPIGTVMSRLFVARQLLKKHLKQKEDSIV